MSDTDHTAPAEAVAIVGLAGRFPRARNLDEFWERLAAGEELVRVFTDEELAASGISPDLLTNPAYVKARAVLEDADLFDATFFGINPREAELMDPQQRLFLECAWEALENAGYDPGRYAGAIGVYAGLSMNSYLFNNLARNPDVLAAAGGYQLMLSSDKDFLATRAAYKLDLHGPAVTIQTACSTSLVAVQMAYQSLLAYQCDMALAGGVSVSSPRAAGYLYQPGMIMSPDGHCRAFDARGRGIVAGEGVGLVVLKRLSEALADGDTIHAIIKGAAINNDGAQKVGYTAPSVDGQAEAIALAQAMAGVAPHTIGYIEAHGTGTELGDPIEVAALTQAFGGDVAPGSCAIGSVKTNIGHLDAAAGIAGLLKTVLALKHRQIPPSLHFEQPNPNIDFASSPFYVNAALRGWPADDAAPLRAGVSSFGIGGTNAHVVLEEAPRPAPSDTERPGHLLLLSARTPTALEQATDALSALLREADAGVNLADVAYTLQAGRKAFGERRAVVVGTDPQAAAETLAQRDIRRVLDGTSNAQSTPVGFVFPGQGAQYVNMARGLYAAEPVFRSEVDRCASLLEPHLGLDLRTILFPDPNAEESSTELLRQTALTQPALFVVEYALARLWMAWGIQPAAMLGHSIGEYVAACLAGVFSLEDALALVAARGRLMQDLPGGDMLAVPLSEAELGPLLGNDVSLAAVNAPRLCVASGPTTSVRALREQLEARGVNCRPLHTSHAFHSAMMEPVLDAFAQRVAAVVRHAPTLRFISNLTGTWITDEQATDPNYWAAHLRSAVRFADGAAELLSEPSLVVLEVGPGQTLSGLLKQHPARAAEQVALASTRHPHDPSADYDVMLTALARLWLAGAEIDWAAVHAPEKRRRVPLPTYPFERQHYWVEPSVGPTATAAPDAFPSRRDVLDSWFYQPSWRRVDRPVQIGARLPAQEWLVFDDGQALGQKLIERLQAEQQSVTRVLRGDTFAACGANTYRLPAAGQDGYVRLLAELKSAGRLPQRVLHLWNTDDASDSQASAFYSLVHLAKALGEYHPETRLEVVGSGVFDVVGDEPLEPVRATLLGPIRVIPQEYPGLSCRYIDTRIGDPAAADLVWTELHAGPDAEPIVAVRGRHQWVPGFEAAHLPEPSDCPGLLRHNGVYLITGGTGGIGLALADYLATTARARLVLTGRGPLSDERGQAIEQLRARGAEVLYVQADVTDRDAMRAAVAQTRRQFGRIDGVVHAAGIPGGGIIALRTVVDAERVLSPKVLGTTVLREVLGDEPLDFVALCSSFTSLLGGAGQVDYCAANAFLDAFAHAETRAGRTTIAINWGVWQQVGMAVNTHVGGQLEDVKAANLRNGMRTTEGQAAFARILDTALPQVIVSPQDLPRLAAWYSTQRDAASTELEPDSELRSDSGSAPALHARPRVSSAFAAPRTDVEEQLCGVWRTLLGIAEVGIHDSFFDLGGHSLLATQLLARLQRLYGIELPLRTIFEAQTVAELADRIEAVRWAAAGRDDTAELLGEREEIEL